MNVLNLNLRVNSSTSRTCCLDKRGFQHIGVKMRYLINVDSLNVDFQLVVDIRGRFRFVYIRLSSVVDYVQIFFLTVSDNYFRFFRRSSLWVDEWIFFRCTVDILDDVDFFLDKFYFSGCYCHEDVAILFLVKCCNGFSEMIVVLDFLKLMFDLLNVSLTTTLTIANRYERNNNVKMSYEEETLAKNIIKET